MADLESSSIKEESVVEEELLIRLLVYCSQGELIWPVFLLAIIINRLCRFKVILVLVPLYQNLTFTCYPSLKAPTAYYGF
jgi:hypothetical protein